MTLASACKKTLFLFIVPVLTFLQPATAQTTPKFITITTKDSRIIPALKSIEKQTGYLFVYDKSLEKSKNTVSLNFKKIPLAEALEKLESTTLLKFKISGRSIIVTDPKGIWIKTVAAKPQE